MIGLKPLRIRFNKVDGFIRVYDLTRYLALPSSQQYHVMFFSHNYAIIKWDSYDSLSPEKALTLRNVIILIKSFFTKSQN